MFETFTCADTGRFALVFEPLGQSRAQPSPGGGVSIVVVRFHGVSIVLKVFQ